jgi:adenosylhomocysteine nucleosidase
MRSELRPVLRSMGTSRPGRLGEVPVHHGRAGQAELTAAMIGVGPQRAGQSTERLLDAGEFAHVVVTGIAGGIGPDIAVGDLVTPAEVEDLSTGERFVPGTIGDHRPSGVLSTTAELIEDEQRIGDLIARGIVAMDMETAAVAAVCHRRGIPWSVFRAVSDRPQDGLLDHGVFELLEADGSVNLGRALSYVASRPWRVRGLARLARDSSGASRRAASAAVAACAEL